MSGHRSIAFRGLVLGPSLSGSGEAHKRGHVSHPETNPMGVPVFVPHSLDAATSRNVMADPELTAIP